VIRRVLLLAVVFAGGLALGGVIVGLVAAGLDDDDERSLWTGRPAQIAFTHAEDLSPVLDDLHVLKAGEISGVSVVKVVEDAEHPDWSPDGERIAFDTAVDVRNPRWRDIWVVDSDGSGATRLTNHVGDDAAPAWSPDGSSIAFVRSGLGVYVMNADGSGLQRLTSGKADDRDPAWSPDGRWIAFASTPDGGNLWGDTDLWVMRADGSGRRRLTRSPGFEAGPDWSPDGRRIAFESGFLNTAGSVHEIWSMKADGTGRVRLTRQSGSDYDANPDWSPDGRRIVFERGIVGYEAFCCGTYGLWVMDADGRNLQQVTEGDDSSPAWRPVHRRKR
jgi:Tol biopolymer transport system component